MSSNFTLHTSHFTFISQFPFVKTSMSVHAISNAQCSMPNVQLLKIVNRKLKIMANEGAIV